MLRRIALVVLTLLVCSSIGAQDGSKPSGEKQSGAKNGLRVLFVGHDPDAPKVMFRQLAKERTYALHRERSGAFEALLRYHFESVRVVYSDDYRPEMSDSVDVTVFDAPPNTLPPVAGSSDDNTPATYLPHTFDRPALMISGTSPRIGEPLRLKLDWL